jgi:hypothetical protein
LRRVLSGVRVVVAPAKEWRDRRGCTVLADARYSPPL